MQACHVVGRKLEHYARQGVLRGVDSQAKRRGRRFAFKFVWFYQRTFEMSVNTSAGVISVSPLLPKVSRNGTLHRNLKAFVRSKQNENLPEHRRISSERCVVTCRHSGGDIGLSLRVKDGDFDFATRALIHLMDEIFKVFLRDGIYRDYMMDVWELNPDTDRF
jgi:hypothetical protein